MDNADKLRKLLSMGRDEIVSRKNAWADVQRAGLAALADLANAEAGKVSSDEMATLASEVLGMKLITPDPEDACGKNYNKLLTKAQSLAGSVMSQADGPEPALDDDPSQRAVRSLVDAQLTGQSHPIVRTVEATVQPTDPGKDEDGKPAA